MKYRIVWTNRYRVMVFVATIAFFVGAGFLYQNNPSFFSRKSLKPHSIIIISIDTLRADHLGIYGYEKNTSPNLDRFAKEAIVFERAIAQATFTLASHASIFTSQYPSVHGVVNLESQLPQSKITLAEVLGENGYETAAFVGSGEMSSYFGFAQGFDVYTDQAGTSFNATIPLALEWLKENDDKNFFLYLQGFDVHAPYEKKSNKRFEHVFDLNYEGVLSNHARFLFGFDPENAPDSIVNLIRDIKYKSPHILEGETVLKDAILGRIENIDGQPFLVLEDETISLTREDIDHIVAHYDDGILATDILIQSFFESLKNMGLYDDSIIIVFAGHGEALGDVIERPVQNTYPMFRRSPREELIHVPLLVKHPELESARIIQQIQLIDLFPTILDFLGILPTREVKEQMQGESLVPLMEGKAREDFNEYVYGGMQDIMFVRSELWKLMLWANKQFVLYDLQNDPRETSNVIEQHPEVAEQLKQKLSEWKLGNVKKGL